LRTSSTSVAAAGGVPPPVSPHPRASEHQSVKEMSELEVCEIPPEDYTRWDDVVKESVEGTVFHLSDWVTTVGGLTGRKTTILGVYRQDDLLGGCALYVRPFPVLSLATTDASMTPFGGICILPSESIKGKKQLLHRHSIMGALRDHLAAHFDAVHLTNSPGLVDIRPFTWDGWKSNVLFTNYLVLKDAVADTTSRTVRNALKRAAKNGISAEKKIDSGAYNVLFRRTFQRQDLAPLVPEKFLNGMISLIGSRELGEMWCAKTPSGEIAASTIVVWDSRHAHAWSAAADPELRETEAHTYLFTEICKDLQSRGFEGFNLQTGNTPRLTAFYASYNPVLTPYYQVAKIAPRARAAYAAKNTIDTFIGRRW
jgi:hypothetical protein